MKKWYVEIEWIGAVWVRMPGEWLTRDDAEWAVAGWKQKNQMYDDNFRYVEEKKEEVSDR